MRLSLGEPLPDVGLQLEGSVGAGKMDGQLGSAKPECPS